MIRNKFMISFTEKKLKRERKGWRELRGREGFPLSTFLLLKNIKNVESNKIYVWSEDIWTTKQWEWENAPLLENSSSHNRIVGSLAEKLARQMKYLNQNCQSKRITNCHKNLNSVILWFTLFHSKIWIKWVDIAWLWIRNRLVSKNDSLPAQTIFE